MLSFARRRRFVLLLMLAAGFVALTGVSMGRAAFNTADPIPGQVRFVGIDTDPSGNSFTNVASYQHVAFLHNGDTFTVDIVVDEVDPSDGLAGVEGALLFDGSVAHVVSIDEGSMAFVGADDPGSFLRYNEPLPDYDGFFHFALIDAGAAAESGEGVLARITMHCDSQETTTLRLEDGYSPDTQVSVLRKNGAVNGQYALPIQAQDTATVFCGSTPTPRPSTGTQPPPTPPGTITVTPTPTQPPTFTVTPTPTMQPSQTPCATVSPTNCDVPPTTTPGTLTPTSDPTPTPTTTPTPTPTPTPVGDPTPTPAGTGTVTPSSAPTPSPRPDSDGDGVLDSADNCPNWANASQALPSWPVPPGDSDCDGFPDSVSITPPNALASELFVGTDATRHCASTAARNDEDPPAPDRWPVDLDDSQTANGSDLLMFAPAFGAVSPDSRYDARFDLDGDGRINGSDLLKYGPFFGKTCA